MVIGWLVMSTFLSSNPENINLRKGVFIYESIILGQYVVEFIIRIWSAGCQAKYVGIRPGY